MAFNISTTFSIVFLLVATTSVTQSRNLGGIELPKLDVSGQLVCSTSGNPEPGVNNPPLVGVKLNFSCDGGNSSLAQVQTDYEGSFKLKVNALVVFLLNRPLATSRCAVRVKLPVSGCSLLPETGVLEAAIGNLNLFESLLRQTTKFGLKLSFQVN